MEIFIFGFILILILIPILHIIPMGLTKKEKTLIAVFSFVLAEIGLLANKYLALWKAISILLLLAVIVTYIFETRLRPRLANGKEAIKDASEDKRLSLDVPMHESTSFDISQDDDTHKDYGDYSLGQDAIDRLLSSKKQMEMVEESSHIEEILENSRTEVLAEDSNHHLSEEEIHKEDQSGIIEDSYNNTELFSDFSAVQQLVKDEKEVAVEQEESAIGNKAEDQMDVEAVQEIEEVDQQDIEVLEVVDGVDQQDVEVLQETDVAEQQDFVVHQDTEEQEVTEIVQDSADVLPVLDFNELANEQTELEESNVMQIEEKIELHDEVGQPDVLKADTTEDESLTPSELDNDVDFEELLIGKRFDSDDFHKEEVEVPTADVLETEAMVDVENEEELLRKRSSLFEELDGEVIIENEELFIEESDNETLDDVREHRDDISGAAPQTSDDEAEQITELEDDKAELQTEDVIEEIEKETEASHNIGEEIEINTPQITMEDNKLDIETIQDILEELEVIEEIDFTAESDARDDEIEERENVEELIPQKDVSNEEILDNLEYITTSEELEGDVTISNDVYEDGDALREVGEDTSVLEETTTHQQMLQTMIDYIQLSKSSLSAQQYEELVRSHLHNDLSDHDYYTFAYMLIEHLISQEEYVRLSALLQDLERKFSKYPVLKEQINYLIERYC